MWYKNILWILTRYFSVFAPSCFHCQCVLVGVNLYTIAINFIKHNQPEKTADIWRRHQRFPREVTSEKRTQKFSTDDAWIWLDETDFQPIRSSTQIWVVTRHQGGISVLVSQTPFLIETRGGVAKCGLFSPAFRTFCKQSWVRLYIRPFRWIHDISL